MRACLCGRGHCVWGGRRFSLPRLLVLPPAAAAPSPLAGQPDPSNPTPTRLRAHPCTRDFHARWNLPVYFHLRFTEVAARIDQALSLLAPAPQPMAGEGGGGGDNDAAAVGQRLSHPAFVAVWRALWGLWAPSVFLPPLTPRLVKLMLQVIGRTHRW